MEFRNGGILKDALAFAHVLNIVIDENIFDFLPSFFHCYHMYIVIDFSSIFPHSFVHPVTLCTGSVAMSCYPSTTR